MQIMIKICIDHLIWIFLFRNTSFHSRIILLFILRRMRFFCFLRSQYFTTYTPVIHNLSSTWKSAVEWSTGERRTSMFLFLFCYGSLCLSSFFCQSDLRHRKVKIRYWRSLKIGKMQRCVFIDKYKWISGTLFIHAFNDSIVRDVRIEEKTSGISDPWIREETEFSHI